MSTGILVHARHLETVGWTRLVWGVPKQDSLGSLPKLVELLLQETADEPISTIVFGCGPSVRDNLSEGEYAKRYLLDHLQELHDFPRFADLTDKNLAALRNRLVQIHVTQTLTRSIDEVAVAAELFARASVTRVLQLTAASHAPRCIQIQSAAKAAGLIPKSQQWFLVADDRCYEGADPFSTTILEPAHRGDDPMIGVTPSIAEVMRSYHYGLSAEDKKKLVLIVDDYIKQHAEHSEIRNLSVRAVGQT